MALTAQWNFGRNLALGLAVAGLLGGCGSGSSSSAADKAKAAARRVIKPADNLVTALGIAKSTGVPVQVRFDLRERPEVGQPVDVDLVIVPKSAAVDRIVGKVEADEGLELLEGAQIAASERPAEGAEIHHPLKVRAKRDGIFTFSALLTVDAGGQTLTESFAMPLIAGTGMSDQPAKAAAPARSATRTAAAPASTGASAAPSPTPAPAPSARAPGTTAAAAPAAAAPSAITATAAAH
jgi:hypothetical protein